MTYKYCHILVSICIFCFMCFASSSIFTTNYTALVHALNKQQKEHKEQSKEMSTMFVAANNDLVSRTDLFCQCSTVRIDCLGCCWHAMYGMAYAMQCYRQDAPGARPTHTS